jgi:hypothetical protein
MIGRKNCAWIMKAFMEFLKVVLGFGKYDKSTGKSVRWGRKYLCQFRNLDGCFINWGGARPCRLLGLE